MQPIETQREGWRSLLEISLGEDQRDKIKEFIFTLADYNGDSTYYTTLNFVKDHLNNQGINYWINGLDWKSEISNLASRVEQSLAVNFAASADLPDPGSFGSPANVSTKHVFVEYDKALREFNFQLGFIATDGDEYVFFVHRVEDADAARAAVEKIGYKYLDKDDGKVRNEPE